MSWARSSSSAGTRPRRSVVLPILLLLLHPGLGILANTPKTASFRYRLNNDPGFTCSSSSAASEEEEEEPLLVRRRRSDRLFFEPGGDTRSIMEEPKATVTAVGEEKQPPFEDSVAVAVEEVIAAQGLGAGDWERMQELLAWYLSANGRKTHGFIVSAFLDLLARPTLLPLPLPLLLLFLHSLLLLPPAFSPFSSSSSSSSSNSFKIEQLTEEEAS